jgi:hypothetical protein
MPTADHTARLSPLQQTINAGGQIKSVHYMSAARYVDFNPSVGQGAARTLDWWFRGHVASGLCRNFPFLIDRSHSLILAVPCLTRWMAASCQANGLFCERAYCLWRIHVSLDDKMWQNNFRSWTTRRSLSLVDRQLLESVTQRHSSVFLTTSLSTILRTNRYWSFGTPLGNANRALSTHRPLSLSSSLPLSGAAQLSHVHQRRLPEAHRRDRRPLH